VCSARQSCVHFGYFGRQTSQRERAIWPQLGRRFALASSWPVVQLYSFSWKLQTAMCCVRAALQQKLCCTAQLNWRTIAQCSMKHGQSAASVLQTHCSLYSV